MLYRTPTECSDTMTLLGLPFDDCTLILVFYTIGAAFALNSVPCTFLKANNLVFRYPGIKSFVGPNPHCTKYCWLKSPDNITCELFLFSEFQLTCFLRINQKTLLQSLGIEHLYTGFLERKAVLNSFQIEKDSGFF